MERLKEKLDDLDIAYEKEEECTVLFEVYKEKDKLKEGIYVQVKLY